MTDENAMEWLDCFIQGCDDIRLNEALQIGKNAIKKRIPKKPKGRYDCHGKKIIGAVYKCPNCNSLVIQNLSTEETDYCVRCGQAIDWSDNK